MILLVFFRASNARLSWKLVVKKRESSQELSCKHDKVSCGVEAWSFNETGNQKMQTHFYFLWNSRLPVTFSARYWFGLTYHDPNQKQILSRLLPASDRFQTLDVFVHRHQKCTRNANATGVRDGRRLLQIPHGLEVGEWDYGLSPVLWKPILTE